MSNKQNVEIKWHELGSLRYALGVALKNERRKLDAAKQRYADATPTARRRFKPGTLSTMSMTIADIERLFKQVDEAIKANMAVLNPTSVP